MMFNVATWLLILLITTTAIATSLGQANCTDGDVRLVGGTSPLNGRVEVCYNSQWGGVCSSSRYNWGTIEATVVCQQLGYPSGALAYSNSSGSPSTAFLNVDYCDPRVDQLIDCYSNINAFTLGVYTCSGYDIFVVNCTIPAPEYCSGICTNGSIRLVGGASPYEGRVEICFEGCWGTVCENGFGISEASVVCRQLGFPTFGATLTYSGYYGPSSGPIWLYALNCSGNESSLFDCPHNEEADDYYSLLYDYDYCGFWFGLGVQCPVPSPPCSNGDVRLVNGSTSMEGQVQVCIGGQWGAVCGEGYWTTDTSGANTVCEQLGYSPNNAAAYTLGQGPEGIYMINVQCDARVTRLVDCSYSYLSDSQYWYCGSTAGVRCQAAFTNVCTSGAVRLVGGSTPFEGRVEVCGNGVWGTVCSSNWDLQDASVVCSQLGYYASGIYLYANPYGQGTGPVWLQNLNCSGIEQRLFDCPVNSTKKSTVYCGHYYDAAVVCTVVIQNCTDWDIRLVDGYLALQGRVEVCYRNQWGTICGYNGVPTVANVICRQLGYSSGTIQYPHYPTGSGGIYLHTSTLFCTGNESRLQNCQHTPLGYHRCSSHYNDIGVQCQGPGVVSINPVCTSGTLKLVGGLTPSEGRVEMCLGGSWNTLYDYLSSWHQRTTAVICRQLGYESSGAELVFSGIFGQGNGSAVYMDVTCLGNEASYYQCPLNYIYTYSDHVYDTGVRCYPGSAPLGQCLDGDVRLVNGANRTTEPNSVEGTVEICYAGHWGVVIGPPWTYREASVVCRQLHYTPVALKALVYPISNLGSVNFFFSGFYCGGNEKRILECSHPLPGYYANYYGNRAAAVVGVKCQVSCFECQNGSIRLVGGNTIYEGRVEVCEGGCWGPVCIGDRGWTSLDAAVVCNQLKIGSRGAKPRYYYSLTSPPILAPHCTGNESSLFSCAQSVCHIENYNYAGVECFPGAQECVLGTGGCPPLCINASEGYSCSCNTGYKLAADNHTCVDINECLLETNGCNQLCNNMIGSYSCSCKKGYKIAADNRTCNDIDECILGISGCSQMCNNTNGSYICSCYVGYKLAANNQACNDINECVLGTSSCSQLCNNTVGRYRCFCKMGYKLAEDNHTCNDINECVLGTSGCSQLCSNTVGSYICSCSTGYKLAADNHTCNDINECLLGTSGCTQLCNNTAGGYKCSCSSGYTLAADNRTCTVEINAYNNCSFNNGHGPCGQICNQLPRSVYCTCEYGYSLLEDHFHCLGAPRDIKLTATKSSITATWKPALYDGLETKKLKYVLVCSSGNYKVEKDTGNSTNAMLVKLAPFTTYSCCVSANASMQPKSLACSSIQTMEDAPSDPPSKVYSAPFSYKAVVIRWDPPLVPNGYIIGSNIYLNYSNGTQNTIKLTGGDYRRYLLQNMQADQEVGIQISSSTIGGEGPRSIIQQGRTNCASGTYYSKSSRKCTSQCGCGEGQVQYYYDSISDSWYSACAPVQGYQVGITSISKNNSVYTNSPPGTLAATVHVTYPLPLSNQIQMSMTSYFYTSYFDFDWWKYWWTPTLLDTMNQSTSQAANPTWSGWWSTLKYFYWQDIHSKSMTCNNGDGQLYAITPINIYLASSPRYQGELRLNLYFVQSYYYYYWYYWYWYYYGYANGLSIQVKQHYNCSSLQYYDFIAQGCVGLCSCGSAIPKGSTFCTTINPYWNFATFAHHTIIHQIPYTDPVIPSITTRLYYTLNDWISRYLFDYYFYHAAGNGVHIMLKLSLQYEYSNYTTPATFGTDVPNVVLTLADGTTINDKGSASIVLDDNLSPLTKSCARDSDGVNLKFIPFVLSMSFKKPISSLGTHNFTITAQLTSTERILDSWLQYYTDEMLISITVGPDRNGSKPTPSCGNISYKYLQMLDMKRYMNMKTLPNTLYSISDRIIVDHGFPFGNSLQSEVYISSNGLISFGKPVVYSYPAKFPTNYEGIRNAYFVAPFWSFNDLRVAGNVSYATINGSDDMILINKYIKNYYKTNFTALWVLVVQWNGVHPYPHGEREWQWWWWDYSYYNQRLRTIIDKENTYQAVLATDGVSSYAIFTYDCGKMGWSEGYWSGWNAVVGYTANGEYYRNHPASGYDFIAEAVSCQNKMCNQTQSSIVYNLSLPTSEIIKLRSDCLNLYQEDVALNGNNKSIADLSAHLEPCPCTLWQAFWDFGRFWWQYADYYCFIQRTPASGTTATQQCCYSSWSTGQFGALINSGIDKGSMYLYHPRRYPDLHKKYDLDFKDKCCGIANMCYLYKERRPSNDCAGYRPPVFMRASGDPHITTLDGRTYTFNGWGEYIMLQYLPSNMEDSFTLQGRMVPFNNTSATQFSAFAFGDSNNIIEIGMINAYKFYIYINGIDISSEIEQINSTYNNSDETIVITRETETSISCVTLAGVGITIKNTYGALSFAATVPPSWKGLTKGLMGNFNGNKSDEFIPRNIGMPLPDAVSDRNLHWMFAQTWNVSEHESLFTYRANRNESWQYYSHPDHVPVFADEIVATEAQMGICGNDAQCLYDLSQTNNTAFAVETMQFSQTITLNAKIISNFPPTINGDSAFKVIVGQISIYNFTVNDENDNITVGVVGGIPYNATLSLSDGRFIFNWMISKVDNLSLTFFAKDSLNATSILSVQVQICACRNGGNCTLDGLSNNDDPSVVMKCNCPRAYDGTFCERDRNGCLEASCSSGVQCHDVPAPGVGITCGSCPSGYLGDGTICIDIDECNTNGSTCQQVCTNTPGSYTCSCQDGYSMMPSGVCTDIDECSGVNECQQICTNSAGSYYCGCFDGFQLDSDDHKCIVTISCMPGHNCSDICASVNGTDTCFCSYGFVMNEDQMTCNDLNECDQGRCEQTCRNTIGSYRCSCSEGYSLNDDQRGCTDVDECKTAYLSENELCPQSFECMNTIGSYRCVCPPGYQNRSGLCQVNIPPKIMGEGNSLLVKVGEPAVYHFSVIDDGDTFTVGVVGGTPAGSNLSNDQGNYSFTWILEQVQNITLKFYAIDSLNATAELSVQVIICACQNKGNCSLKGLENITDAQSVIMDCDCPIAYDGRFCEGDRNGCLEASCYSGVQCYDVPAPAVGRTCGPCPKGYLGDGQNCSDYNECADNNGNCSQRCTNYAGSYMCTCSAGYYLEADRKTCKSISATLNAVDITLAGYTVDSFTPEARSKFITSIQNILNTYCNSIQCLSAPMNTTKYTVIIKNAVDSNNGLIVTLQVQTSNILLSSAVITMAIKGGNSTLFADGFIAVSITPLSETSPKWTGVTLIAIAVAVIITILVAVISIVSLKLLFSYLVHHKQKKQLACTGEELNMNVLENNVAMEMGTIATEQFEDVNQPPRNNYPVSLSKLQ